MLWPALRPPEFITFRHQQVCCLHGLLVGVVLTETRVAGEGSHRAGTEHCTIRPAS
ncbi:MAG: hypothetical protein ACKO2L_14170 [Planctomycetaceae bacterium]